MILRRLGSKSKQRQTLKNRNTEIIITNFDAQAVKRQKERLKKINTPIKMKTAINRSLSNNQKIGIGIGIGITILSTIAIFRKNTTASNTTTSTTTIATSTTPSTTQAQKNIIAFLRTIQYAEGTFYQPNPFAITFGYKHTIQNFNDHPTLTGEWQGEGLSNNYCQALNLPNGCRSTAAGAYQFIAPTWQAIKNRNPGIDFTSIGQDRGAVDLISRKNALNDAQTGRFETAIRKCNRTWASLPDSPYGQPTRSMEQLRVFYEEQGGFFLV